MEDHTHLTTPRLRLDRPVPEDLEPLHAIYSDARLWTHFPSLRHTERTTTESLLRRWIQHWEDHGIGPWMVRGREPDDDELLGNCGCTVKQDAVWNLGYRFSAGAHGHGWATEAARQAVGTAQRLRPGLPVVALLMEHNIGSRRVAEKVGLSLQVREPEPDHPEPGAVRLIFADRKLSPAQRRAAR